MTKGDFASAATSTRGRAVLIAIEALTALASGR